MAALFAQDLIRAFPSPVLLIGPDNRIVAQSAAMTALLVVDLTGRNHIKAFRTPAALDAIATAQKTGEKQTTRYLPRVDGADISFVMTVTPQADHVLVTLIDETAEQETNTLRRDFVANVSHELRTPLTALLGFIETLRGPAKDDPKAQTRFLGIMADEADRMRRLVDDLLSLSRVEETQRIRPTELVDMTGVVQRAADLLGDLANSNGTTLDVETPKSTLMIPGDEAQLLQVTNNLIENAIKYGASEHGITISLSEPTFDKTLQQDAIALTVKDHGEGIESHHFARLTERFYRVDGHRAREMGGTGLGLAIVKHITNRHRGRISFESEVGQGTAVTIRLPVAT